jgi:hypothetical protein
MTISDVDEMLILDEAANLMGDPASFPAVSADGSGCDREVGCRVVEASDDIRPATPVKDYWVWMALRVRGDHPAAGFVIELGDLVSDEIAVMTKAIAASDQIERAKDFRVD